MMDLSLSALCHLLITQGLLRKEKKSSTKQEEEHP